MKVLQGVSFERPKPPKTDQLELGKQPLSYWQNAWSGLSLLFFDVLGLKGFQIPSPNHTNLEKSKHMSEAAGLV